MAMELKNLLFLGLVAAFGILYYFDVQTLPQAEERHLVVLVFWGLMILVGIEVIKSVVRMVKDKGREGSFSQDMITWVKSKQAILVFAFLLYIASIPMVGFFVSSLLFILLLNYLLRSRSVWELFILPVILLAFVYIVFVQLLGVKLPSGFLF